ncbi:hypothetical protein N431DRAFT_39278 [Stipitochalara longipes BDJ]|nr:hypothetical protein N431DRAFT_39278 [Stipitochalara longipes BDJ]
MAPAITISHETPLQRTIDARRISLPPDTNTAGDSCETDAAIYESPEAPSQSKTTESRTLTAPNQSSLVPLGNRIHDRGALPEWRLSEVPTYAITQSRTTPGQIKGLEWLSVNGRRRFEAREAHLLSKWGVTPGHSGTPSALTCILVSTVHAWSFQCLITQRHGYERRRGLRADPTLV